jgi:hypothetical protein
MPPDVYDPTEHPFTPPRPISGELCPQGEDVMDRAIHILVVWRLARYQKLKSTKFFTYSGQLCNPSHIKQFYDTIL